MVIVRCRALLRRTALQPRGQRAWDAAGAGLAQTPAAHSPLTACSAGSRAPEAPASSWQPHYALRAASPAATLQGVGMRGAWAGEGPMVVVVGGEGVAVLRLTKVPCLQTLSVHAACGPWLPACLAARLPHAQQPHAVLDCPAEATLAVLLQLPDAGCVCVGSVAEARR